MRLVSYNILDGGTGRADPLAEIILAQRSDIVVLVETQDPAVVDRIAARTGMEAFVGGDDRQSAAILSRWPIVEAVDIAATRPGLSRSFLLAVVQSPEGVDWTVGAVHLHAGALDGDERQREVELAIVLDATAGYRSDGIPHILAGDFNSTAPEQEIDPARCKPKTRSAWDANGGAIPRRVVQRLRDCGYLDTLQVADEPAARSGVSFTTRHPGQRVDYIFTHSIAAGRIRAGWIEQDRLARYASDHYAVGAQID